MRGAARKWRLRSLATLCAAAPLAVVCWPLRVLRAKDADTDVFSEFRPSAFNSAAFQQVKVNQRQLVAKMLARYSTEFGVLRELVQNADDSGSTEVNVRLQGEELNNGQLKVTGLLLTNNGRPFSEEDWDRLTKIAEGNPNENAVGMYGVGFYSVFSVSDSPMVSSLGQLLMFKWSGDQLVFSRQAVSRETPGVTFFLPFQEGHMWHVDRLCRLLQHSLPFARNLQRLTVSCNDQPLFRVERQVTALQKLDTARLTGTFPRSPRGFFTARKVKAHQLQLSAWHHKLGDIHSSALLLLDADLAVNCPAEIAEQTRLILHKDVPRCSRLALLYDLKSRNSYIDRQPSQPGALLWHLLPFLTHDVKKTGSDGEAAALFASAVSPSNGGFIYVGFPTSQSTGGKFHIGGQFYPTIEREMIDFQTPGLGAWNAELLSVAGSLARYHYDRYLAEMPSWTDPAMMPEGVRNIVNAHSFVTSSPSPKVHEFLRESFFSLPSIALPSACHGVQDTGRGKTIFMVADPTLRELLKTRAAIIHPLVTDQAKDFLEDCVRHKLLREISLPDLQAALRRSVLEVSEYLTLIGCLKNHPRPPATSNRDEEFAADLRQTARSAVVKVVEGKHVAIDLLDSFLPLSTDVPLSLPLPNNYLPLTLEQGLKISDINIFLGLRQATLPHYYLWLAKSAPRSLFEDPRSIVPVLSLLSRMERAHGGTVEYEKVIETLQRRKCMPTDQGMSIPSQCHFALSSDVPVLSGGGPTVALQVDGARHVGPEEMGSDDPTKLPVSRKLLRRLGVKHTIDISRALKKLAGQPPAAVVSALLPYADTLDEAHWAELRRAPLLPNSHGNLRPANNLVVESGLSDRPALQQELDPFLADTLLHWPGLHKDTPEWRFFQRLGLRTQPSIPELLKLVSIRSDSLGAQKAVLKYLGSSMLRSDISVARQISFVRCTDGQFRRPEDCFMTGTCGYFPVADPVFVALLRDYELAEKLGPRDQPEISAILTEISKLGPRVEQAPELLRYLAQNSARFSSADWSALRSLPIVPSSGRCVPPETIFVASAELQERYGTLLDYGNGAQWGEGISELLLRCGAITTPSAATVAQGIAANFASYKCSPHFDVKKYTTVLLELAPQIGQIPHDLRLRLAATSFLPAYKTKSTHHSDTEDVEWEFVQAKQCHVIDLPEFQGLLPILCAPNQPVLRDLYLKLGSTWLSSEIRTTKSVDAPRPPTQQAQQLLNLIRERRQLLLFGKQGKLKPGVKAQAAEQLSRIEVSSAKGVTLEIEYRGKTFAFKDARAPTCAIQFRNGRPVLFLCSDFDLADVATALSEYLYSSPQDMMHSVYFMLNSPTSVLRKKGYLTEMEQKPAETKGFMDSQAKPNPKSSNPDPGENPKITEGILNQGREWLRQTLRATIDPHVKMPVAGNGGPPQVQNKVKNDDDDDSNTLGHEKKIGPQQKVEKRNTSPANDERVPDFGHADKAAERQAQQAIDKVRPASRKSVEGRTEPEPKQVQQTDRECEPLDTATLHKVGTVNGINVFSEQEGLSDDLSSSASRFACVLQQTAQVLRVPSGSMNMFVDIDSNRVAFNHGGELYFNLRYFHQVHKKRSWEQILAFWYVTCCHELAHNISGPHDIAHERAMQTLIHANLPNFSRLLNST
eukprot:TRINITY_DN24221_c0_g1_i1.p1 TRINITY_DN24221_c0_g1~~TRINITY_DN24221_c0_g1_i1.p1  ORF type:complete len:1652 (-),score=224.20 TRINITY_DN24221_c0_g1_i1:1896-6830(-)